jgi:putative membrane protein
MQFLVKLVLNGLAIVIAASVVPGLRLSGIGAALMAGVILGFVNAIVRPVLFFLTLPVTLLTLGLFIFVLNALCLALTAALVPGFTITSFTGALIGAFVVTIVSWILNGLLLTRSDRATFRG